MTVNQEKIMKYILDHPDRNVFITGCAGTGKTFLIKQVAKALKDKVQVCAMTGIAARNIDGVTLHSFLNSGMDGTRMMNRKRFDAICSVKNVIVDEISMISENYLRNIYERFGNRIRFILVGDFLQLLSIEEGVAFKTATWKQMGMKKFRLNKVLRQSDPEFIEMLNDVRINKISPRTREYLKRFECTGEPSDGATVLFSTNRKVDAYNMRWLNKLETEEVDLSAVDVISGPISTRSQLKKLITKEAPEHIKVKLGATVIMTRNSELFANGSMGVITAFRMDGTPVVTLHGHAHGLPVTRVEYKHETAKNSIIRNQYPIKLAWALTIHKSQGLTLDSVFLDITDSFAVGQCYTGLSRIVGPEKLAIRTVKKLISNNRVSDDAVKFWNKIAP